jgi:hypothetical protein
MSREDIEFCVVTGTVIEGFEVTGPFNSEDEARDWASDLADAWVVMPLHAPEDE